MSDNVVDKIFNARLTAFKSVPVKSKNKFFVLSVTVVRMPFIIGGNERTSLLLSKMIG